MPHDPRPDPRPRYLTPTETGKYEFFICIGLILLDVAKRCVSGWWILFTATWCVVCMWAGGGGGEGEEEEGGRG